MAEQDYYGNVKKDDWESVNRYLRLIGQRLTKLEGYGGESTRYADLALDGNLLKGGPDPQDTAKDSDYITAGYLDSDEAGRRIARLSRPRGLIISKTTADPPAPTVDGGPPGIEINPTFIDFTDATRWIQVGLSSEIGISVASTGVTLTGLADRFRSGFSGVVLRGYVYPDPDDGEMTIKHYWDNYDRATDLAQGQTFLFGSYRVFQTTGENWYCGYGGRGTNSGDDKFQMGPVTPNGMTAATFWNLSTPATSTFVIEQKIRHAQGGFWDMAEDYDGIVLDGGSVQLGGTGSSRRAFTWMTPSGASLMFGVLFMDNSAVATARLTKVEIVKGRYLRF